MSKQAFSLTGWPPPATASTDLTNDYATSLGTKLDNGFALTGGSHQCSAGLLRAHSEMSPTVPPLPCFFHDNAGLRPGGMLDTEHPQG